LSNSELGLNNLGILAVRLFTQNDFQVKTIQQTAYNNTTSNCTLDPLMHDLELLTTEVKQFRRNLVNLEKNRVNKTDISKINISKSSTTFKRLDNSHSWCFIIKNLA